MAEDATFLHEKIVGAILVRKGNLLAAFAKPKVPMPQKDKLTELIVQAELVLSISRRNTSIFGEVKVVSVQHSILTIFVLPVIDDVALAFAIHGSAGVDYDYEELTGRVNKFVSDRVSSSNASAPNNQ